MIYFDNAATSRPKPDEVLAAFEYYVKEVGTSPGRGAYELAIKASRMLYQSRKTVADFFGITDPSNVVFTKNSTEAINFFFRGFLKKGDHVLISSYEHNAVLRPLHKLYEDGIIEYSVLPADALEKSSIDFQKYVKKNTVLLVMMLASNLTGEIVFNKEIAKLAHDLGINVFVDSSQGAGKKIINMNCDNIDFLAFTGHKDLLALPGTGGLVSRNHLEISPLIQGGTGIHGDEYTNPDAYPDSYEAGTINMPAIWSLKTSIDYINCHIGEITMVETSLLDYFISELQKINGITIYNKDKTRVPTFCFNLDGVSSNEVVYSLSKNDICVRGGIHCAIKAHETIGTVEKGAVRVSLNFYNNKSEIDKFISVIQGIKDEHCIL